MKKYRKALVAVAGFAAALGTVGADGVITSSEAIILVSAGATAFGVYFAKNEPPVA